MSFANLCSTGARYDMLEDPLESLEVRHTICLGSVEITDKHRRVLEV